MRGGFVGGKGYPTAIFGGVAGAWMLDEADAEQANVILLDSDDNPAGYWTGGGGATLSNEAVIKQSGTNSLKIVTATLTGYFTKTFGVPINLSSKNKIRVHWYGQNSGAILTLSFKTAVNDYYMYTFTDNWIGYRWLDLSYGLFAATGSPNWASIFQMIFGSLDANNTWYMDRLIADVGVPVLDSSGNGYDAATTGTTIVASPFHAGKTARNMTATDKILGAVSPFGYANSVFTVIAYFQTTTTASIMLAEGGTNNGWFLQANAKFGCVAKNGGNNAYVASCTSPNILNGNPRVAILTLTTSTSDKNVNKAVFYLDGLLEALTGEQQNDVYADSVTNFSIGSRNAGVDGNFVGVLGPLFIVSGSLTALQASAFTLYNYPDPTLEAGKVCVLREPQNTLIDRRLIR